jgi:outer membrane protein TolC
MHTALLPTVLLATSVALAAEAPPALTLDEALHELESRNLTLAQARARADEAQGVVRQALAALLPTAAVGGSYVRNNAQAKLAIGALLDSIEGGLSQVAHTQVTLDRSNVPADTLIQPLESFAGQASLRLPLFAANGYQDYLATTEAARSAGLSVDAARLQLRSALLQSAAWAQGTEDIALATERALEVAQAHARSAGRRFEAGTVEHLTELQAQTDVVRREGDLVRARADQERAWLALGVLLGRAEPVRVTLPPLRPAPGEAAAQLARALEARPELQAQAASLESASWQVRSAWWRLAPQLSASLTGTASNVAYVTGLYSGWRASVDLTWTLYDGGFRYGKRVQAQSQLAAAQAALAAQRVEVQQQVLDARRDLEVAIERLRLGERQKALAEEVAGSARRGFEAGLASSLDVLDANDRLYQSEVGLADARARLGMAAAALDRATGALLGP